MSIDPNRVKEIFLEAAELPDEAVRVAYLDRACEGDAGLREQVEALLRSHDPEGSFLGTPAAVVRDPFQDGTFEFDSSDSGVDSDLLDSFRETYDLNFLSPTTRPDSLGRLGHYEVLQVLGSGGFGIVFRAFDDILQRVVAVKVMAPEMAATSPARKRFLREARSSAAIRHENVVQVYEVCERPLPYLVMEFIPGETLQQKLDRTGPLEASEVLRIGRQVAEGLAAAHSSDLIHRDIKPGNILIEGGTHKVKITDFGLARAADDASISHSGIVAGTPMYMAPEQALGHRIDQHDDLFSLGSVLYQMVSGRPPFRAPSTLAVLKRVAEESPRPIPEIIPETPDWLCGIIQKLHAKNPDARFQSAREVADLLADCETKVKAKQDVKNILPAPVKPARRKWVFAALILLPVIALAVTEFAGVNHLFRQPQSTESESDQVATKEPLDPSKADNHPTPEPPVPAATSHQPPLAVAPFTDADVKRIAGLPAAKQVEEVRKQLMRLNPKFDGTLTPTVENDVVTGLKVLTDEVNNLAPVGALKGLTALDCRGTYRDKGKLSDLSPLKGLALNYLDCSSTQVSDLNPLAGMPLNILHFAHNPVTDLSPLKGMPLSSLGCAETKVWDLSPLKGMKLRILGAQLLPVTDLSPLEGMPLTGLDLYHTIGVTNLEPLKGMPLDDLNLQDVPVSDLSPLKGMTTLRTLHLQGNRVSDLTPLQGLKLTTLLIHDKQVSDLSPLKGMPLLRLEIYASGATDLRPLEGMPLQEIRLSPEKITQGLDILRIMKSLKTIGIDGNQAWPPAEFWQRYDNGEFTK